MHHPLSLYASSCVVATPHFCLALTTTEMCPFCKETCESDKANRGKVQFPQKTGSRSYRAHIYAIVRTIIFFFRPM